MQDVDRRDYSVGCIHGYAAFLKLSGKERLNQLELRDLFRQHRPRIEKLANALYEAPAWWEA